MYYETALIREIVIGQNRWFAAARDHVEVLDYIPVEE
jgi:hypothetical protein